MSARRGANRFAFPAVALAILLVVGCRPPALPDSPQPASAPFTTIDLTDWVANPFVDEAERALPNLRIVSTAPNVTEMICALGLRGCLVGRTRYCDYPPGVEAVPAIGALLDLNVEIMLNLRPDLVIVSGESRQIREKLEQIKLRSESVPDVSVDDLFTALTKIGDWTGRPRTAAALIANFHADMNRVDHQFHARSAERVLVLIGTLSTPASPPYVAGENSFYDWMLRRAGHQNIVAGHGSAFAPLSLEFIGKADPDVIIELAPTLTERPGGDADALVAWAQIPGLQAVASRRVHVLIGNRNYLLGPRLPLVFRDLCTAIQQ